MGKQRNLTVRLDEETIRQAKILAAERSSSISQLVAEKIAEAVRNDLAYSQARTRALALLDRGFHMGDPTRVPREELHARR